MRTVHNGGTSLSITGMAFVTAPRRMTLNAPYQIPEAYKRFALDSYYLLDEGL